MTAATSLAQDTNEVQSVATAAPQRPRSGSAAKTARVALALVGGLGVGLLVQTWQGSSSAADMWARVNPWAAESVATAPVATTAPEVVAPAEMLVMRQPPQLNRHNTPAVVPAHRYEVLTARLDGAVLVGDQLHAAAHGAIALPAGTRFQLSVSANRAGTLALYAINPDGVAGVEPLWSVQLQGGKTELSPTLRLDGTRGLENLSLVLRGSRGELMAQQQVQILHL